MSLPATCRKCGAAEWKGEQVVTPPSGRTMWDAGIWHRLTRCRHCGWGQEEIRHCEAIAITSRHQPIDLVGKNPFEESA